MKDYTVDILKGTAMEEVQIIKKTSTSKPTVVTSENPKRPLAAITTTTKKSRRKKSATKKFTPKADSGNRRSKEYATIRIPKEFTLALKILFDGQKLTNIMDQIVCEYLNTHQVELEEKYSQLKPF